MTSRLALRCGPQNRNSLSLAVFTAFGFILELLIVKEKLFARREHEIRATVHTL
jgi:hypothetical protein